jgi:methionyl-tRNA formyltransferase
VLTQPDRPAGRGLAPVQSAVKRLALARGLQVRQPATLKPSESWTPVREARPELMVVAAYGLLLPQGVLEIPPRGAINIHASLLPRWRGAAPIQRALLAGDRQTGISIMQMDAGLDTGPVLAARPIPITAEDDAGSLHDRLAGLGAEMIVESLADVASGGARPIAQPEEGASYAPKIGKQETVLDWTRPAAELERAVRAFRPAPGTRTLLEGEPIKIWRAAIASGEGAPGEVLDATGHAILIACGSGALAVTELQRAGARRIRAAEFLRGRPLGRGTRFGGQR